MAISPKPRLRRSILSASNYTPSASRSSRRARRRLGALYDASDYVSKTPPKGSIEPDLRGIRRHRAGNMARDAIAYAIISRAMVMNLSDETILADLATANRPIRPHALTVIRTRPDFIEYYRQYRENLFRDTDSRMRSIFTAEKVNAALKIVKIMHKGRKFDSRAADYVDDEALQLKAAIDVIREAGTSANGGAPSPAAAPMPTNIVIALMGKAREVKALPATNVRTIEVKVDTKDAAD